MAWAAQRGGAGRLYVLGRRIVAGRVRVLGRHVARGGAAVCSLTSCHNTIKFALFDAVAARQIRSVRGQAALCGGAAVRGRAYTIVSDLIDSYRLSIFVSGITRDSHVNCVNSHV